MNDLQASIRFFEGLGFAVEERWEDNGTLNGVMLRAGNAHVGLSQDDWKKGRDRTKGAGARIFIETAQNIDELATRAKKAGVKLSAEPHDTEWGSRGVRGHRTERLPADDLVTGIARLQGTEPNGRSRLASPCGSMI